MLTHDKISLIHLARNRLAMVDDDYRALLKRVSGVTSSKQLDDAGFTAVMDEFRRLGFESTANRERRMESHRSGTHATYQQRRKIEGMWDAWKGRRDPDGLNRWLSSHFHVSNLRFLARDQAPKVIAALGHFKPHPSGDNATSTGNESPCS
jgi:phage gp16-like protein